MNISCNISFIMFLQLLRVSPHRPKASLNRMSNKKSKINSKVDGDELQSPFEYEDETTPRKRYVRTLGVRCNV